MITDLFWSSSYINAVAVLSAVGPWHKSMVDLVVRDHAVNDSALPQIETMQMRCRVTHTVEAI